MRMKISIQRNDNPLIVQPALQNFCIFSGRHVDVANMHSVNTDALQQRDGGNVATPDQAAVS